MVENYAPQIFQQHDRNMSGTLEMYEFPAMCQQFFQMMGCAPPSQNDMMYLMFTFDVNKDCRISYPEFRNMLYYLGGQRNNPGMPGMGMGMGMQPGMGMSMGMGGMY